MAGSRSPSPAPSKSGSDSGSESSHKCPNCRPEMRDDYTVPWTVHLLDMPPELQSQIYLHLPNLVSVVSLRLVCRQLNDMFQSNRENVMLHLRNQLTEPVREYYEVLQRLKFADNSIDYPPPGGWPNITPEIFAPYDKTDFAISVLRHLPYVNGDPGSDWNSLGYKSEGVDYHYYQNSTDFRGHGDYLWNEEYMEEDRLKYPDMDRISGIKHIVTLAMGHESGGIILVLDTFAGILFEEEVRGDNQSALSPREFCDMSRDRLERLGMVFCNSEENFKLRPWVDEEYWDDDGKFHALTKYDFEQIEADGEPMPEDADDELDWNWIAYLYHKFGWPGKDYRKEECKEAIFDFQMRWQGAVDEL